MMPSINWSRRELLSAAAAGGMWLAGKATALGAANRDNTKVTIDRIEAIPLVYPTKGRFKFFEDAKGRNTGRPSVVVKITASNGAVGWGQSVPTPRWSYETLETAYYTIMRHLAPALVGLNPFDAEHINKMMDTFVAPSFSTGQPICKAGIDLALFDLTGKLLGQSAFERWNRRGADPHSSSISRAIGATGGLPASADTGGQATRGTTTRESLCRDPHDKILLSWTLNPKTLDEIPGLIEQGKAAGYRNFNVKVAPDPKFDVELCRTVKRLVPDGFLWADANGGYTVDAALDVLPRLKDAGVAVLEQPLRINQFSGYRRLRKLGVLPIVLDEGVVSTAELEEFIKLEMLDGLAMKPARCGGINEAARQIELIQRSRLMFLGSGLTDPDISLAASALLYAGYGLKYPAALNGPQFLSGLSILKKPLLPVGGYLPVPTGPGLGIEVDEAALDEHRLRQL